MEKILAYNFSNNAPNLSNTPKSASTPWTNLYDKQRRDSNFAAVFQTKPNCYIAIRDHLGVVPLFYRISANGHIRWSFTYNDLLEQNDTFKEAAVARFLGIPSAKVVDLFEDIHCVPPGTVLQVSPQGIEVRYTYTPHIEHLKISHEEALATLEQLLDRAIERTLKEDTVGLYLSGGMDSGLLGAVLAQKGVRVNAYTALPWGFGSDEEHYARINVDNVGCAEHHLTPVDQTRYQHYLESLETLYRSPYASTAALNIAAIWEQGHIAQEKQVFFAQNTDTLTTSVPSQSYATILGSLPPFLAAKLMPYFNQGDLLRNYLNLVSHGRLSSHPYLREIDPSLPKHVRVALAGMLTAHTPSDSEVLNGISVACNQLASNPYYDMDLIEFYLSLPLRHKLAYNPKLKTLVSFDKSLFRALASKYLPHNLIYRKKALTLARSSPEARVFFEGLPKKYGNLVTQNDFERLALGVLQTQYPWLFSKAAI